MPIRRAEAQLSDSPGRPVRLAPHSRYNPGANVSHPRRYLLARSRPARNVEPLVRTPREWLKAALSASLGDQNYQSFDVAWTGQGISTDHLSTAAAAADRFNLCREVRRALETTLRCELESLEEQDPLQSEIQEHASFAAARA